MQSSSHQEILKIITDLSSNIWINSSAGSGKTTILTNRFLYSLIEGHDISSIYFFTFTNIATNEMKKRVITRINKWTESSIDELKTDELIRLKISIENNFNLDEFKKKLLIISEKLNNNLSLKIQTIHSFCNEILQMHYKNSKIVIDQEKSKEILIKASEIVFQKIFYEKNNDQFSFLSEDMIQNSIDLIFLKSIDSFKSMIFENLQKRFFYISKDIFMEIEEIKKIKKEIEDFLQFDYFQPNEIEDIQIFFEKSAKKFIQEDFINKRSIDNFLKYKTLFLKQDNTIRSSVQNNSVTNSESIKVLNVLKMIDKLKEKQQKIGINFLLNEIYLEYESIKSKKDYIDYDDIIIKALEILDSSNVSQILSEKISHILVDEAQDMNINQWNVIYKIAEEIFCSSNKHITICVVGDPKQSIYGFHGGNQKNFYNYQNKINNLSMQTNRKFIETSISQCYRCSQEILDITNKIFQNSQIEKNYQNHFSKVTGGSINIYPIVENSNEKCMYQILAENVADKVLELKNSKTDISDIMILIRNRNIFLKKLIIEFKKYNIKYSGIECELISENIYALSILQILEFILNTDQNLLLYSIAQNIFQIDSYHIQTLVSISNKYKSSSWNILECINKNSLLDFDVLSINQLKVVFKEFKEFYKKIKFWSNFKSYPVKLLMKILSDIEFFNLISLFLTKEQILQIINIIELVNINDSLGVLFFLKEKFSSTFLKSTIRENTIKILTVHSAKGLESPIVILPDTTSEPKDSEDYEKLLYVGITRSKLDLYVYGWGKNNGWYKKIFDALNK